MDPAPSRVLRVTSSTLAWLLRRHVAHCSAVPQTLRLTFVPESWSYLQMTSESPVLAVGLTERVVAAGLVPAVVTVGSSLLLRRRPCWRCVSAAGVSALVPVARTSGAPSSAVWAGAPGVTANNAAAIKA